MRLNGTEILIERFVDELTQSYRRVYSDLRPDYQAMIGWFAGMSLENIATSDALYHNMEHTIQVTLAGLAILHGKHIRDGRVTPRDWLHFVVSLVCHDIGYVKGICRGDGNGMYATGIGDEVAELPSGSTDASLLPYHVDRGKMFIEERFGGHELIDVSILKENVELTRFPVPNVEDHQGTKDYPGLLRAADLIGQLSDPRYLNKIAALFYEFEETGINAQLNYKNPGELRRAYPAFYWQQVYPYIKDAVSYLQLTQAGQEIVANLYSQVFVVEHEIQDRLQQPSGRKSG